MPRYEPGGLSFQEGGIEDEAAEVIKRGNQPPFFAGCGGPQVYRRVVLNELAGVVVKDFAIVDRSVGLSQEKPCFLARSMMVGREIFWP